MATTSANLRTLLEDHTMSGADALRSRRRRGRDALSFGMLGCDLHCGYCQNWVTSQALRDDEAIARPRFYSPTQLVDIALKRTRRSW